MNKRKIIKIKRRELANCLRMHSSTLSLKHANERHDVFARLRPARRSAWGGRRACEAFADPHFNVDFKFKTTVCKDVADCYFE